MRLESELLFVYLDETVGLSLADSSKLKALAPVEDLVLVQQEHEELFVQVDSFLAWGASDDHVGQQEVLDVTRVVLIQLLRD